MCILAKHYGIPFDSCKGRTSITETFFGSPKPPKYFEHIPCSTCQHWLPQASPTKSQLPHLGRAFTDIQEMKQVSRHRWMVLPHKIPTTNPTAVTAILPFKSAHCFNIVPIQGLRGLCHLSPTQAGGSHVLMRNGHATDPGVQEGPHELRLASSHSSNGDFATRRHKGADDTARAARTGAVHTRKPVSHGSGFGKECGHKK